ncbi:hypothetical protein TNCV_2934321 [Trichonephila clavipes]|nr:hypothetical protein TNCV_2934321 [Trichonephila clavipes]
MCLKEEIVQLVSHTEIASEHCYQRNGIVVYRIAVLPLASVKIQRLLAKIRDKVRMVIKNTFYWTSTAAITSSPGDRHVIHMTLMDCAAPSGALHQELEFFARQ